ncbi:MAG: universal stress protein [Chloroflexi bacterium]|nr:universal stress protein [Chloroflexota bacterium]
MIDRILVGLDGSLLAESILPYVSSLSKAAGAEVTLLQVVHLPDSLPDAEPHATLEQLIERSTSQAAQYLRPLTDGLTKTGIVARYAVKVGDTDTEIVNFAQRENVDLIALATHGRSGLQRWARGSVADDVLHTTQTPLLLVRPQSEQTAASSITQIVVPLDGSPLAEAVLPYVEVLALALRAPVALIRTTELVTLLGEPGSAWSGQTYDTIIPALQDAAEDYLRMVSARLSDNGVQVTTDTTVGFPGTDIEAYVAEHPGSLVVMATHARSGMGEFFLGSVTRRVVQRTGAPVLVVRPVDVRVRPEPKFAHVVQ